MKNVFCVGMVIMMIAVIASCKTAKIEKKIPALLTVEDVASMPKEDLSSKEMEALFKAITKEYLTKNIYNQITTKFSTEEPFLSAYHEEDKILELLSSLLSKYQIPLPGDETLADSQPYLKKIRYRSDGCELGSSLEMEKYELYGDLLKNVDSQDIQKVFLSILNSSVERNLKLFKDCAE